MISALVSSCQGLVVATGYLGIISVAVLENFFPPIPSEAIFPFVGFVAAQGLLSLPLVIAAGTVGTFIGALLWYLVGYLLGDAKLKSLVVAHGKLIGIKWSDIVRAKRWFERYETPAIFFARIIPLVRTFISVPAGFVQMNIFLFSLLTIGGSMVWIGILTIIGYVLGERWGDAISYLENYELVIGLIVLSVVALFFAKRYRLRRA